MNDNRINYLDNLTLPIIAAPMFLISTPDMVIESCKSGIIGSLPLLNARTTDILDSWLERITSELDNYSKDKSDSIIPWAVNIIVHKSNKRYKEDLRMIKKYKPPIVITSLGDPTPVIEVVHNYGGIVISDVTKIYHAKKAAEKGVDGLILVCSGAGGHGGNLNPFAFISEVKSFWNGMVILAGAISTGQDILAAKVLGADLVSIGTKFIATKESLANNKYERMLIESNLEDIIYTDSITGVNANFLLPSIKDAGIELEILKEKGNINLSQDKSEGVKPWKDIWSAGQGVGNITKTLSVSALIDELQTEYNLALKKIKHD